MLKSDYNKQSSTQTYAHKSYYLNTNDLLKYNRIQ